MNCFNERRNESNIKKNATQKNAVHQELTLDARARVGALFVFVFVYRRCIGITGWVLVAPLPSPSGGCGAVPASWLSNRRMWACHFRVPYGLSAVFRRYRFIIHHFLAYIQVYWVTSTPEHVRNGERGDMMHRAENRVSPPGCKVNHFTYPSLVRSYSYCGLRISAIKPSISGADHARERQRLTLSQTQETGLFSG